MNTSYIETQQLLVRTVRSFFPPSKAVSSRHRYVPQDTFDLRKYLGVCKVCASDGRAGTGRHAGAATLAQSRNHFGDGLIRVEYDGIVRAQIIADAAAGAQLGCNRGPYRLHHHRPAADQAS